MGEKGNISSEELVAGATGVGAVVATAGTQVTAIVEQAGGTVTDKILDKGADAGIAAAGEKWRQRHDSDEPPTHG